MKLLSLLFTCAILISTAIPAFAQKAPTTYEAAKRIGDAKLTSLQKANAPAKARYVVLNKGKRLKRRLKYENTVYIVDKDYNLRGSLLNIPANSIVVFRGGSIRNGTLIGNNTKYSIQTDSSDLCQLSGTWERIAPVYLASELGMIPNDKAAQENNYITMESIVNKGFNLFLDGAYYVVFSKPLKLNYQLHIYGGGLYFSHYAFDLSSGGGLFADGVHFSSIDGKQTDDILCGTREKHHAFTTSPICFDNCHFSCNRVLSLEYKYTNPENTIFGIRSLVVKNCYADQTAKFLVLDSPIINNCVFKNNTFTNFTHAPIYLCPNHSKRVHPNEVDANPWAEEVISASCDVVIDSNIFLGKEVSVYSYYCAALVEGKKCLFTNNYLKDLVNYSDNNSRGYTAYDAYLSCVEVNYENNYVENMMSYTKDCAHKPQTEIGKSKMNPLEMLGYKATRRYVNNIFICDGNEFRSKGADAKSITTDIFSNVSPIESYVWVNNAIIYKNIELKGRTSSTRYGSFFLKDNYIECSKISGNLVFTNSAYDVKAIEITGNTFYVEDGTSPIVYNQLYNDSYHLYSHGKIIISDNVYLNTAPIYHFFVSDTIRVHDGKVEKLAINGNLYLSDYTGNPRTLQVRSMDVEIALNATIPHGCIIQYFSDKSVGTFTSSASAIPKNGILYYYIAGGRNSFKIVFSCNGEEHYVNFENNGKDFYYVHHGERHKILFGQTDKKVWYHNKGLVFSTSFINNKDKSNAIMTLVTPDYGAKEGNYKLSYISL